MWESVLKPYAYAEDEGITIPPHYTDSICSSACLSGQTLNSSKQILRLVRHCIPGIWHVVGTEEMSASVQMTQTFMYIITSQPHHLLKEKTKYP